MKVAKSAVIYLIKVQQICEWNMHKLSCLQPLPTHLCLKSLILTLIFVELNLISFCWCLFFGESFYVLFYTELFYWCHILPDTVYPYAKCIETLKSIYSITISSALRNQIYTSKLVSILRSSASKYVLDSKCALSHAFKVGRTK